MARAPKRHEVVTVAYNKAFAGKTMWCDEHGDVEIKPFLMWPCGERIVGVAWLSCGCRTLFDCPIVENLGQLNMALASAGQSHESREQVRQEALACAYCGA